jgi:hypothetical protein
MPTDRVTDLLDEFAAVSAAAPRPASPARRIAMRSNLPAATLAGAVLVVLAVVVGGVLASRPGPIDESAATPSAPASSPAAVVATPEPTVATPEPTVGPCDPNAVAARITAWDGAAGQRIAAVELVNEGAVACLLEARNRPRLVAGDGEVLIEGRNPATTIVLTIEPGAKATTQVSVGNYCKPAPMPPIRVAFVVGDRWLIVAEAVDPTDATVPPCNGPGQPGTIDMHPWELVR